MADRMTLGPYKARIRYEAEGDYFRGVVKLGCDWFDFCGRSIRGLRREFRISALVYEEAIGKRPRRRV